VNLILDAMLKKPTLTSVAATTHEDVTWPSPLSLRADAILQKNLKQRGHSSIQGSLSSSQLILGRVN
jgi:hypothetical protein